MKKTATKKTIKAPAKKAVKKTVKKVKGLKGHVLSSPTGVYMAQVTVAKNYTLVALKGFKTVKGAKNSMEKQLNLLNPKAVIDWGEE